MQKTQFSLSLMLVLSLVCVQTYAQDDSATTTNRPEIPADEFDRGAPRGSGEGFMAAADAGDYDAAAEYMDLRNLRGEAKQLTGAQLARRLNVIIGRATWIDIDELVDDPAGRSNDNLPTYRDSIGTVLDGDKQIQLLMQKVPRGDGVSIWKVSNATVSIIPKLYATYGYPEEIEDLRRSLPDVSFLGYELFKWVVVLAAGLLVYAALFLIALVFRLVLGDPDTPSHQRLFRFMVLPVGIWAVIMTFSAVATALGRGAAADAAQRISPIPILVTVWVMLGGINLIRDIYANRLQNKGRSGAAVLLRPVSNAIKIFLVTGAVLIYLNKLGVNITTVLAGLGVGGIAVALALQKPMEDVFGAITLYAQQPIRVGDFCRVGEYTGTIEEIGLRTTRIRTLADTLIAVPNAQLANAPIDNISARKKILFQPILRLRYDTTPAQLTQILDGIRKLLSTHDRILQDNPRVRFKEIADDALLIEVYGYLDTNVWAEYLKLAEGLNMQILEIIAIAGTSLSLPSQTLHIEQTDAAD
jgi:MscS family membrane protein